MNWRSPHSLHQSWEAWKRARETPGAPCTSGGSRNRRLKRRPRKLKPYERPRNGGGSKHNGIYD